MIIIKTTHHPGIGNRVARFGLLAAFGLAAAGADAQERVTADFRDGETNPFSAGDGDDQAVSVGINHRTFLNSRTHYAVTSKNARFGSQHTMTAYRNRAAAAPMVNTPAEPGVWTRWTFTVTPQGVVTLRRDTQPALTPHGQAPMPNPWVAPPRRSSWPAAAARWPASSSTAWSSYRWKSRTRPDARRTRAGATRGLGDDGMRPGGADGRRSGPAR